MIEVGPHEARLVKRIIDHEGGFVDHAADRGGATSYGITAETLGRSRRLGRPATSSEVQALTYAEAEQIYVRDWIRSEHLSLHMIVDTAVCWWALDTAVLFGQARAGMWLQKAAGGLKVDGVIGERSIARINATGRLVMIVRGTALRLERHAEAVRAAPSQAAFIVGWTRRALSHLEGLL